MKNSLIDLAHEYKRIEFKILESFGELNEINEKELEEITKNLVNKIDSCAFVLERLKKDSEMYREFARKYQKIAQSFEKTEDRLKEYIKFTMKQLGSDEISGENNRFKITNKRKKIKIIDEASVPPEFKVTTIVRELNLELIEQALFNGMDVPGVELIETETLRSYLK